MALRKQQEMLSYYSRFGLTRKYNKQKKTLPQLTAEDVGRCTNMRMVFVTQSPVLTNEVKQYYANLKQQLAAHLMVVEKVREEKKQAKLKASQDAEAKTEEIKTAGDEGAPTDMDGLADEDQAPA